MAVGCIREGSSSRGVDSIANNAFPPSVNDFGSVGAVFTYVLNGSAWLQQKYVKGTNPTPNLDQFGWAVSLSQTGDTLLVGAKDASFTGLAFLF